MRNGIFEHKVVLISADPGSGKTTLVKKIAYDWAAEQFVKDRNEMTSDRFTLVLAVPLRNITETSCKDILELSVKYLLAALS